MIKTQQNGAELTKAAGSEASSFAGKVLATKTGLRFPDSLTFEEWQRAGHKVARIATSSAWFIGDWIVCGQDRYEGRYRDAVEAVGLDYQTIRNYAWVARRFELSRRRDSLSFQHHAEVASRPPEEQDYWLRQAEKFGWSRSELRRHLRGIRDSGRRGGASLVQPLKVDQERAVRWRSAAERAGSSLEGWIISSLDLAANSVLTESVESV